MLYTAPEVIKQQPYVGPEIDIWGLGILCTYRSIYAHIEPAHTHTRTRTRTRTDLVR
jgi:serine/threonine protein kinase